jgi:hypothetical protein
MAMRPAGRQPAPGPRALLVHAGITALALAVGLGVLQGRGTAPATSEPAAGDLTGVRRVAEAAADLASAERALEAAEGRLAARPPAAEPPAAPSEGPLEEIVPEADAPPADLDAFAGRLIAMETRTNEGRLLAYYDMVTRPLLPGFDDATLGRVGAAFAAYVEATKAVPWGLLGGQAGGPAESWRQLLEDQDRRLRERLARDLPAEKVELLHERFALRVPAPGEPLPTPRLAGTQPGAGGER